MKIVTMVSLGMGCILLLVSLLGVFALYEVGRMWQSQEGLYRHPLTVRRALSDLRFDMMSIKLKMDDMLWSGNAQRRLSLAQDIEGLENDAARQLRILHDRYLGPRKDLDDIHDAINRWQTVRPETLRLLLAGMKAEAAARLGPLGPDGAAVNAIIKEFQDISAFSVMKGDQFFNSAKSQKNSLRTTLIGMLAAVLALTFLIGRKLLHAIREPLGELSSAAEKFRSGEYAARSGYSAADEFGALSGSFNALAKTIQEELAARESCAAVVDGMLKEDELRPFCRELLKVLLQSTGSQIGAVFALDGDNFQHIESIGLSYAGRTSTFSAVGQGGEPGIAAAMGRIQHIRDIPTDTRFTFTAVCGDFIPSEIITIPVLSGSQTVALVSLASLRPFPKAAVRLVNDLWPVLSARMNSVLVFNRIQEYSERLEGMNRELEAQTREIITQKDELSEQNIELELQKKQLDEANRLKSAFLSNMSHELRTPLNSVIALSGVLSRRLGATIPEEERDYLKVIERNGKSLLALINDILDLSRIEAGRDDVSFDRFSVGELVADVAAMLEHEAREKGILLSYGIDKDVGFIVSDEVKCRHILQNLVANAVKFTQEGSVKVRVTRLKNFIRIAVADTGIGIAPDKLECIFDEFRQADETTTKQFGGTGLGLAIARKYAAILNGKITVESSVGSGSTFTLIFPDETGYQPVRWEHSNAGEPLSNNQRRAAAVRAGTILLVDDNSPAIIQLTDILIEEGYCVEVARNGKEALDKIEQSLPDAIILDLMMPEVDGFQVLATIRGVEKTARIPVLILTAKHVSKEELSFLTSNHIHQLIQKGDINRSRLIESIDKMMVRSRNMSAQPEKTPEGRGDREKPVVLVVDDNPDSMTAIRAMLDGYYYVIGAEDGKSGLEQARIHAPDVILMDLSMPVMDGFQALNAIRGDNFLRHLPVIAMTADAMSGSREKILCSGFDGYLSKPVDCALLDELIRESLK